MEHDVKLLREGDKSHVSVSGLPLLCPPEGITWSKWICSRRDNDKAILLVQYEIIMIKKGTESIPRKRELLNNTSRRLKRLLVKNESIPHQHTASARKQYQESLDHYNKLLSEEQAHFKNEQREKETLRKKRLRAANPTIDERANEFKRLKANEAKIISAKVRMMIEETTKKEKRRDENKRCRIKRLLPFDEECVFVLTNTVNVKRIALANNVLRSMLRFALCDGEAVKCIFNVGFVSALFGCMTRFTAYFWFSIKGLEALNYMITCLFEPDDKDVAAVISETQWYESKTKYASDDGKECARVREWYDQIRCFKTVLVELLNVNVCDFIGDLLKYLVEEHRKGEVVCVHQLQTILETLHWLVHRPVPVSLEILAGLKLGKNNAWKDLVNPNYVNVCEHSMIETYVVELLNTYEQSSSEKFVCISLQLVVMFVKHNNVLYRPNLCTAVVKTLLRFSEEENIVSYCCTLKSLLSSNLQNLAKLK